MATQTVLGTCHHDCPDSCGWVATVEDGTVVKLRGNPAHPFSQGELCPKVNRFIDRVYSPDRVLHPLLRTGTKGEGGFARASWDDALAVIAERVHGAVARHGGETVLPWASAGNQSLISGDSLSWRFLDRLGASVQTGSLCGATASAGTAATYGDGRGMDPMDLVHSRFIILWGTNTRMTNRHLWPFIEEARSAGATVVVVDPVRTITADSADWFVQPLPGTDTALALAMMNVLIRDDLVDHDYVEHYATGFGQLRAKAAEWEPERAAQVCGLPAEEIVRLARAYGSTRPAAIRVLIGAEHREQGGALFQTIACLPVLTGAWRDRGGGYARSVGVWSEDAVDEMALIGRSLAARGRPPARHMNMNHLGRALTDSDLSPPVDVLLVWNGNPLVSVPNAELTRRGLERDDLFCVVHEQFLTDTARYADVVLPATTQLEQRDVVPAWGHLYLGWNEPAIAPLGEAVSNTELFRRLSSALGFTEPELFASDDELLDAALHRLTDEERAHLRSDGFIRLPLPEDLRPYAEGGFATPTVGLVWLCRATTRRGRDLAAIPTSRPASRSCSSPPSRTRASSTPRTPHLPKHGPAEGTPRLQISRADAEARGLADGAEARVWNDRGELVAPVQVSTRVRPGVVSLPFGWWRHQHASGSTANSLTNDEINDLGGGVAFHDTLVEVSAAGDGTQPVRR